MEHAREIDVELRYLHIPIENGAPQRWMRVIVDGVTVREFRIELAQNKPDLRVHTDISPWHGRRLRLEVEPGEPGLLAKIRQGERSRTRRSCTQSGYARNTVSPPSEGGKTQLSYLEVHERDSAWTSSESEC